MGPSFGCCKGECPANPVLRGRGDDRCLTEVNDALRDTLYLAEHSSRLGWGAVNVPDAAPMALAKVMAFMEEMERISDSGEIVGGMHTHLLDFGFHSLMVGRVSSLESPLQNLFASVIETELTDWLQVYRERRYVEVDPAARRLKRSVMPFELREVERESNGDPRAGAAKRN